MNRNVLVLTVLTSTGTSGHFMEPADNRHPVSCRRWYRPAETLDPTVKSVVVVRCVAGSFSVFTRVVDAVAAHRVIGILVIHCGSFPSRYRHRGGSDDHSSISAAVDGRSLSPDLSLALRIHIVSAVRPVNVTQVPCDVRRRRFEASILLLLLFSIIFVFAVPCQAIESTVPGFLS